MVRAATRTRRWTTAAMLTVATCAALAGCVARSSAGPAPRPDCTVAVVGDSLTVGVVPHLEGALTRRDCRLAWWDARSGRPTAEGVQVLAARARAGQLPDVLIVGLGTNDRHRMADFGGHVDEVMRLAGGRQVIWIDLAYEPVRDRLNAVLAQKAARYPDLRTMEWDRHYWARPEWQASDRIHATTAGYRGRAELMAGTAEQVVK